MSQRKTNGDEIIGINPFLWALISACDLLVLLAAYCDAIGRPRSRSSKKKHGCGWRAVDTPRNFDIALDHEQAPKLYALASERVYVETATRR